MLLTISLNTPSLLVLSGILHILRYDVWRDSCLFWFQIKMAYFYVSVSSVQFSRSVVSSSLRPHESQHARPPWPSPTPGVHSNLRPSNRWCHPASWAFFFNCKIFFPLELYRDSSIVDFQVHFKKKKFVVFSSTKIWGTHPELDCLKLVLGLMLFGASWLLWIWRCSGLFFSFLNVPRVMWQIQALSLRLPAELRFFGHLWYHLSESSCQPHLQAAWHQNLLLFLMFYKNPEFSSTFTSIKPHIFKKKEQFNILSIVSFGVPCCCSVTQSCPTPCDPVDCSTPGFPVLHHLLEFAWVHVHGIGDAIQPSHPLSPSLLLSSVFPSIQVSSNKMAIHIKWPKYWSFSFSNIKTFPHPHHKGLFSDFPGDKCFPITFLQGWVFSR